jgi:uncharacterized protein (DUF736 family)
MAEQRKSIGAWKKQTQKGEVINFTINGQKYSMWQNTKKSSDKSPDFNIIEDNWKPSEKTEKTFTEDRSDLPF